MQQNNTVVIGGGHGGLAISRLLTDAGRDHVVLERGRIAESWRSRRWDSLRLLTPNWMTRLPGWDYRGDDPDGFMTAGEVADYVAAYARSFAAPVVPDARVERVEPAGEGYLVHSTRGSWRARNVVVATGASDRPRVPSLAADLPVDVHQTAATLYRRPDQLPSGGVLVVGASASGAQIAAELARAGRDVTIAVGRHTRLPRRHGDRDIMWWLDRMGLLDRSIDEVSDLATVREPSLQLIGGPDAGEVHLAALRRYGVQVAGRLTAVDGRRAVFAADLADTSAEADTRARRTLARIDSFAGTGRSEAEAAALLEPLPNTEAPRSRFLGEGGIGTVLWATGYRRSYPWLHVPVLDGHGEIRHTRGVTAAPGLYVIGMRWQSRRSSTFLDGVRHDARTVVDHLLARRAAAPALAVAGAA